MNKNIVSLFIYKHLRTKILQLFSFTNIYEQKYCSYFHLQTFYDSMNLYLFPPPQSTTSIRTTTINMVIIRTMTTTVGMIILIILITKTSDHLERRVTSSRVEDIPVRSFPLLQLVNLKPGFKMILLLYASEIY